MRNKCTLPIILISLYSYSIGIAQNVYIPDANFKSALLASQLINTNGDNEIQLTEAVTYTLNLDVSHNGISDLTGIGAFTSIPYLDCSYNLLVSLDITPNTSLQTLQCGNNYLSTLVIPHAGALKQVYCAFNQLTNLNISSVTVEDLRCTNNQMTNLNVSADTNLVHLECGDNQLANLNTYANKSLMELICWNNQLTILDVSANKALISLFCANNYIQSLDVSNNTILTGLWCNNNKLLNLDVSLNTVLQGLNCRDNDLTYLNVKNGNNINSTFFDATNNSHLKCIQVDSPSFMNSTWPLGKDSTTIYSLNCSNSIINFKALFNFAIYPNPSYGIFTVNISNSHEAKLVVRDLFGRSQFDKDCREEASLKVDLHCLPKGLYFVELLSGNEKLVKKVVIE